MLQSKWWSDIIFKVNDCWCFSRIGPPHKKGHGTIYRCPGDVRHSLNCEWLSHQVPGPRVSIPSPAWSCCIVSSAQKQPILCVTLAWWIIGQIWKDTSRVSVRKINLCWLKTSGYQHSWSKQDKCHPESILWFLPGSSRPGWWSTLDLQQLIMASLQIKSKNSFIILYSLKLYTPVTGFALVVAVG